MTIGAVQVITMLVLLVRTKTLAVVLGPEAVGVMAVIDKLVAVIAQTASLSLPFAAARFLPGAWTESPASYRDLFARMRNVLLALALTSMAAAVAVAFVHPLALGAALLPYRDVVVVAMLGIPVLALVPFLQNAIAGRLQQNRAMLAGLAHAVVLAVAVAGIAWNGLVGFYAAYAVLGAVLVVFLSRAAINGAPLSVSLATGSGGRASFRLPGSIWRFARALLVLAFLSPYTALFVHYAVLSAHGAKTAGWMQAAIGIGLAARAVLGSAHAVFLTPNVNRGGPAAERMAWADRFQLTFCVLAILAVPPLLLFPEVAVRILYSAEFGQGATFVAIFVAVEVLGLLSGTYQSLIVAMDHLRFHVASNLVAQLLVIALAAALVEPLGIAGAGCAMLSAPVFLLVATMAFLYRSHRLRMPRPVAMRTLWLLVALVVSGLAGAMLPELSVAAVTLKVCVYLTALAGLASSLSAHERRRATEYLERLRGSWR